MARRYAPSDMTAEDVDLSARRWAASGMMALTGSRSKALGPPAGLVPGVDRLARRFPELDALTLLAERAALLGLSRSGTTSCGGGCRLLQATDGWLALSLARPEDIASVPAWLHADDIPEATGPRWEYIARAVAQHPRGRLVDQGVLLGLPIAALGHRPERPAIEWVSKGKARPSASRAGLVVVDLTSLWAGPLCGSLLSVAGAEVIKVESGTRPDGARRGPAEFFDLLNGSKKSVVLDFEHPADVKALATLVRQADVVLESSRPRALQQLGIRAEELLADGPRVWVSITGYGRDGTSAHRVAFGDDAAAAGGLVAEEDGLPRFCGDAIADPLTGLAAADACLAALERGGRWLLDVSMASMAASLAGPTLPVPEDLAAAPPRARPLSHRAPELGAHGAEIRARFDLPA
jgi:hypothetical protein